MRFTYTHSITASIAVVLLVAPSSGTVHAETYRTSWITSWSGCECTETSLDYTDDQINQFNAEMNDHGGTKLSTFANSSVWGSDFAEDYSTLGAGSDRYYSDDVDLYSYSGHGDAPNNGSGSQTFRVPFCKKGTSAYLGSCNFNASAHMYMGEQSGLYYASPHAGRNRWILWATCYSVHTRPNEQHSPNMYYGSEYIIGFRGLSTDAEETDEFLADFVINAYSPSVAFKGAWFDAVEDTWIDDTGAVISGGVNTTVAQDRRDHYNNRTWARRGWDVPWPQYAWSWHEG